MERGLELPEQVPEIPMEDEVLRCDFVEECEAHHERWRFFPLSRKSINHCTFFPVVTRNIHCVRLSASGTQ